MFYFPILLIWSYTHTPPLWSHQIPLRASVILSCFISFSPLCALALFHLSSSHDSSSSQHELMLVSPILNIQIHKTPFSHSCFSSYSYFPFKCEHIEGSDAFATWSFSPHCGPSKPFCKVFSLLFFARYRNENIIFTICNTTAQLHFSFEILSSFGLSYSVLSGSPPNFLLHCFLQGSASFPRQVSENLLNASVLDYLLFLLLLLCSYYLQI